MDLKFNGLFDGSAIGFGPFEGFFHFFYGDEDGVIIDAVDLFEVLEPLLHFLHPSQPLQGCLAHIISMDVERDHGSALTPGRDYAKHGHQEKGRQYDTPQKQNPVTQGCVHGFCPPAGLLKEFLHG